MEIVKARYEYRQRQPRLGKTKKFGLVFVICLLLFSSGGYSYAALSKDVPEISPQTVSIEPAALAEPILAWPGFGQAAIGSVEQGVLAHSVATEEAKPIASMTKLITALTILEKSPLALGESGVSYTFDATDVALYRDYLARQGSVVPVTVGQTMTQAQALEYLLVISANNLADSMVRRHFGTMEAYLTAANALVKSYGLSRTVVSDASGFSPATVSTPSELIALGAKVLAEPVLAAIVAKQTTILPGYGEVRNSNQLLVDPGIIGLKTGTTDEAGRCLLFAANYAIDATHNVTVIGVVMGAPSSSSLYSSVRALLASAKEGFGEVEVLPAGTLAGTVSTPWGQQTNLITKKSIKTYGWKTKQPAVTATIDPLKLPLESQAKVGAISLDGQTEVDIVAAGVVNPPDALWKLRNYF